MPRSKKTVTTETAPADRLRRISAAVRVQFVWWGVHRALTAEQRKEVGLVHNADGRLLTAGKKLIDVRHPSFRRLASIRSRAVSFWRGLTLPYVEPGVRLIRQTDIDAFAEKMQGLREELIQAEADLSEVFNEIKRDARERLGRLYSPEDYPSEVRGLFDVSWDFPSVEPPEYLMRLNPEIYEQEQQRVARRFDEAVKLAEEAFVGEFARLVSHLTERLCGESDGEPKIFRDTAVTNLAEFFERFKRLSIGSNDELDQLVAQAHDLVQDVKPQALRDNEDFRRHVATELSQVQAQLDGLMVDRPRRRIMRAHPSSNGVAHDATH